MRFGALDECAMAGHNDPTSHERAAYTRQRVQLRALLIGHGRASSVTIRDYSLRGLRLEGARGFAPSERVTVELLTGHRLPVVVAWLHGTDVGVRFVGPIAPGNPALQALEAAADTHKRLHLQRNQAFTKKEHCA